jgi:4a-hydroxytetrahydrobiopterin dehydratase
MPSEKMDLAKETCIPCQGGVPPMAMIEAQKFLNSLHVEWSINSSGHLERVFLVKNFSEALNLAVRLGQIAETQAHHPDFLVSYGKLKAEIWTHKVDGLTRADFVLAAKFDDATNNHHDTAHV